MAIDRNQEPDIDIDEVTKHDPKDRENLLAELEVMSGDNYASSSSAPSFLTDLNLVGKKKKKNKKEKLLEENETSTDTKSGDWFTDFMKDLDDAEAGAACRRPRRGQDIEEILTGKKKKKKKKKKEGEPTDFKKEFETENQLYTNLLRDNTKFTDSLQKAYDVMTGRKASGRGMTKNEQDLIANITSARSLSAQLIDKRVNLKKLATELSMKERKELGIGAAEGTGLGEFGSSYLKKLIEERHVLEQGGSDEVYDMSDDEVANALQERVDAPISEEDMELYADKDRSEESEAYLRYENSDIRVYVSIDENDRANWYYIARDPDGNEVPDYPLPVSCIGSINRSTNIMTDEFGQKYEIEWR